MGWIDRILGRPEPPSAPTHARIIKSPGGMITIDLTEAALDSRTLQRVAAELSELGAPRLRVWLFSTVALREIAQNTLTTQRFLQELHAASLGRDQSGSRAPDMAVLSGELDGLMGMVYLLWSLQIPPYPLGDDGEVPALEARTARGELIVGATGEPIGTEPPKPMMRALNLTRDKLEGELLATPDESESVKKLLELATGELSFIESVLGNHG